MSGADRMERLRRRVGYERYLAITTRYWEMIAHGWTWGR